MFPHVDTVKAEVEPLLGPDDELTVEDYGHNYGAVIVSLSADSPRVGTTLAWFQSRPEWGFNGPAMEAVSPGAEAPVADYVSYRRDVSLDPAAAPHQPN